MRTRMKSHSLDAFSLAAGAVFVALGVLVALDGSASREIDPRWFLAVLLVGLGVAGALASLDWSRRSAPEPPTPPTSEEETQP